MKAEHRKELQTNALADRLGRFFQGFRTKSSSGGLAILVILLLAVAVGLAFLYFSGTAKRARSEMWVSLDKITADEISSKNSRFPSYDDEESKKTIEKLERISTENPDTKASLVARFRIARINLLNRGINLLPQYGKSDVALKNLDRAEEEYQKLANECKDDATWRPQALLGIAKVAETRAVRDVKNLDKALRLYEEIAKQYGETAAGKEAAERVTALKDGKKRAEIEELYKDMGAVLRVDRPGP